MNKQKLIDFLTLNDGKPAEMTWFDLSVKFNIGEGLSQGRRAKKTQDIWRSYKRTDNSTTVKPDLIPSNARIKSIWGKEGSYQKSFVVDHSVQDSIDLLEQAKKQFIADAKAHAPKYDKVKYKQFGEEKLLEISIYDHHFGKLAWAPETDENYDLTIALKRFREAVEYFTDMAKSLSVTRILFVVGNDILNTDGMSNATTAGTPQDTDVRWQKAFSAVRRVLIESIDKFRNVCPVDVVVVPGNHDRAQCYYLGEALDCWYHNCKEVNVDNSAKLRKYYRYGKSLLGFTHGNEEKISDLPMIMAVEATKEFAETTHREWHLGHWHANRVQEQFGIVTRILPSLTGTDFWHKSKGYIGNMKSAQAHLYSMDEGFIAFFQYNL